MRNFGAELAPRRKASDLTLSAILQNAVNADECPQRYASTGIFECVRILANAASRRSV